MVKASSTTHGITVLDIEGKPFVAGLFWQILTKPSGYMAEARALARKERERVPPVVMEVVSIRQSSAALQAGFVVKGAGAKKGMYSLASAAADMFGPSFIAGFDLGDGRIATVAALNGAIIPDSDGVHPRDEGLAFIREKWRSLSGALKNGEMRLYSSPGLITEATPVELKALLPALRASQRLRQLGWFSRREIAIATAIAVAVIGSAALYSDYAARRAEAERQEELRRQADLKRLRDQSGLDATELALMHPWSAKPKPSNFTGVCTQALWSLPLTLDGWVLSKADCSSTNLTSTYVRSASRTENGFRQQAQAWGHKLHITFAPNGETATLSFAVSHQAGGDDALSDFNARSETLVSHLQRRLVPVTLTPHPSIFAPTYAPRKDQGPASTPDWKTIGWTVKGTNRTPSSFLSGVPDDGNRITSISLTFDNQGKIVWQVDGETYGK
ncbi:type 4b pilus protein PilO2 [Achromobacter aloeverae]